MLGRRTDGLPVLWAQRRRLPLLGSPVSGLRFDVLDEVPATTARWLDAATRQTRLRHNLSQPKPSHDRRSCTTHPNAIASTRARRWPGRCTGSEPVLAR